MTEIPEDVVWDAENPPQVFKCSHNDAFHIRECDGTCGQEPLSELDVLLGNEMKAWARAGMVPMGSLVGTNIPGIPIDLLKIESEFAALVGVMIEDDHSLAERIERKFKELYLRRLWNVRMANEDSVRQARVARMVGVAPSTAVKRVIGPNGKPL